jgi:pimeloyl-ACP methyl ester carboxylesterase
LPEGRGPFPAVLLISGTGANTRDEEVDGHKVFVVLADALARRGVAVLAYDKRGVGASEGRLAGATTADLASDAAAALRFLRGLPDIDPRRVGLLGHSEGGIIAPMIAAEDDTVAFVALMAAPGVRGDRLLVAQAAAVARANGAPEAYVARRQAFDEAVYAAMLAAPSADEARARVEALAARGLSDKVLDPAEAGGLARDTVTPWVRYFVAHDPATTLAKVRAPILAVIGARDLQVPAAENLAAIRRAAAGNPDATVVELPGLNHLLQTARTGAPAEYGQIEETIAPQALTLMADWVAARATAATPKGQ